MIDLVSIQEELVLRSAQNPFQDLETTMTMNPQSQSSQMTINDMIPGMIYILDYPNHIERVFCTRIIPPSEQRFGSGFYIGVKFFSGNSLSRIEHILYEKELGESYQVYDTSTREIT